MSVAIMGLAWKSPLPSTEKMVLLALADCANDHGESIYPSIPELARKTSLTERCVQSTIRSLEGQGLAIHEGERSSGVRVYAINVNALTELVALAQDSQKTDCDEGGVNVIHQGGERGSPGGERHSPPINRDSLNRQLTNTACVSDETHARVAASANADAPQDGTPDDTSAVETQETFTPQGNAPAPKVSQKSKASASDYAIPPSPGSPPPSKARKRAPTESDATRKRAEEIFVALSGIPSPSDEKGNGATGSAWWKPLREMLAACGNDLARFEKLMGRTVKHMAENHLTLSNPRGAQNVFVSVLGEENRRVRPAVAHAKTYVELGPDTPLSVLEDIMENPQRYSLSKGSLPPAQLYVQRIDREESRKRELA